MQPPDPKNILVIRLSSIGDILLATPLLRGLRRRFPQARIDCLVKDQFRDLLRTNPHLTELLLFDTRQTDELQRVRRLIRSRNYELILDIHKNPRSLFLTSCMPRTAVRRLRKYYMKRFILVRFHVNLYRTIMPVYRRYLQTAAGWDVGDDGLGPDFIVDPAAARAVADRLAIFDGDAQLVGLAPSATYLNKRWPAEYYAEVAARLLREKRCAIVLLGGVHDREITARIAAGLPGPVLNVAGDLNLMQSAAVIDRLKLLITNDTGLMHLGTALHVPTVAIFGPTTRELGFFPTAGHVRVLEQQGLTCRPCTHMGLNHCPKKHFRCMRDISPERVYAAAVDQMTNRPL